MFEKERERRLLAEGMVGTLGVGEDQSLGERAVEEGKVGVQ